MLVTVRWRRISRDSDPWWGLSRGLYAYVAPGAGEILYVGKVDGTTVRRRWPRSAKEDFWNDLERRRGIVQHAVLVGEIEVEEGRRLTRELLADIESLLINRVRPWANIQSRHSRISRPGLHVICEGDWPLRRQEFRDVG